MKELIVKTDDERIQKEAKGLGLEVVTKDDSVEVKDRQTEDDVVKLAVGKERIVISSPDWRITPLENLVSRLKGKVKLIAKVKSAEEAKVAFGALELGADGVLLETDDLNEINKTLTIIENLKEKKMQLIETTVKNIRQLGLGARSCIDTCSLMEKGEGMLVGCSSEGMLLVQAEVEENPSVSPRPFRVNVGAVSLYVLAPNNKTKYVQEIKAGDEILLVNTEGLTRPAFVGRSKIEIRPLMLIEAETEGKVVKAILQTAETIKLLTPDGSKPVTELKVGDKLLAYFQEGKRHFGTLVEDEYCVEK